MMPAAMHSGGSCMIASNDFLKRFLLLFVLVFWLMPMLPSAAFAFDAGVSNSPDLLDGPEKGKPLADIMKRFPPLAKFMFGMTILLLAPVLARRFKLPDVVGLILAGILFGPYILGLGKGDGPLINVFGELGKLLLLFFAGMEIDLVLFKRSKWRTSFFGAATLLVPLLAGLGVGVFFGYSVLSAVLIGSLLASHTLIGFPIVQRYKLTQGEPVIVTIGATVFTDTISLLILAICVSIHTLGFKPADLALQVVQIILYIFVVLAGLSRLVHWFYNRFHPDQDVQMLILLLVVMTAATLAEAIHLESIVGAFMTGLAVNSCLRGTKTHEHIEVLGKTLFIPVFFFAIGLSLDLPEIWNSICQNPIFVISLSVGLIAAKFTAAWMTGKVFKYKTFEWLNMWSLSIPQVAATIAAALVAFQSIDSAGNRLIDQTVMSGVLVMVIATAIGGPILTELFSKKLSTPQEE
jgi:Kef-type K+ transport system membrane component KefB